MATKKSTGVSPLLSYVQAKKLLQARGKEGQIRSSIDLELSHTQAHLTEDGVLFESVRLITWDELKKIAKHERKCYAIEPDSLREIRVFSETTNWVRTLCPTEFAPTTLVSGFPMHRIKGTNPWADTEAKVRAAEPIRGHVLDTATGLGYTAIQAAHKADQLTTIELDPAAIELARHNPWSQELFTSPKINQLIGDSVELLPTLPSEEFTVILHDPPTKQFAGELYSLGFYQELRRVLKRQGRLFYYIGDPSSALGSSMTEGVMRRLKEAGFQRVDRHPEAFGVTAYSIK